ncbi:D-glycero-alpha-D-manno-heptose-1,7-bisphosphate 7-phosphatase [Thermogymnomonas acidicola]|uniref:D-glycero-alpha-D-manno-heptose-1,7-bisphosphate 7-phosphatase n=1 Tax=Thermogymnomonas acidicola TaxID=399579 RepID=UPI001E6220DA|nr:HAD family hydrolase [Thermogymnomonas acidicola]
MQLALFIDRDGTINRDCPYCHDPRDLHIYEDAVEVMGFFQSLGFMIVIVTNQSGIGRGYFSVEEMEEFNSHLLSSLRKRGVRVTAVYYCPHRPEEGCSCRKPATGLVERAARELSIDLSRSFIVGDRDDVDGELARRLSMPYMIMVRDV